jgi:hypothetical protein
VLQSGAPAEVDGFAAWREVIPPSSNVYVAPAHYSAAFCWFTLQRPDYLSVNQSAGVVFSREAALEVVRRSEVLSPMMEPDWRLYSAMRATQGAAEWWPGRTSATTRCRIGGQAIGKIGICTIAAGCARRRPVHDSPWHHQWNLRK